MIIVQMLLGAVGAYLFIGFVIGAVLLVVSYSDIVDNGHGARFRRWPRPIIALIFLGYTSILWLKIITEDD